MSIDWLFVAVWLLAWVSGFLTCGLIIGTGPFWGGVRGAFSFNVKKIKRRWVHYDG